MLPRMPDLALLSMEVFGARLSRRRLPLCPELELWLLGDEVDLNRRVSELFEAETAPYWAFCWASGQALARHLLDHPRLVHHKRVVDFGAGSGVAAIAALRAGAACATAVDCDPEALRAARANARLNGVTLATSRSVPADFDVLVAGDVLYEVGNHAFVSEQIARGRTVLLGDPLRQGNARLSSVPQAQYEVTTLPDVDQPLTRAVVYVFAPPPWSDD
jgi:predicted nicotinamide N-methyase